MKYIGLPLWVREQHIFVHPQHAAFDAIGPSVSRQTWHIDRPSQKLSNSKTVTVFPTMQNRTYRRDVF